jgi:uncharacterized membrane protein
MTVFLALAAAFLFAWIAIFTKKGLAYGNVHQSVVFTFGADLAFLACLLVITQPAFRISWAGLGLFVFDGLLAMVGAAILFVSVHRLGPAIAYPIKNAAPLPALLLAVLFLGEQPGLPVVLGALLTAAGVIALSLQPVKGGIPWKLDTLISVLSAFIFALDNIIRRVALQEVNTPLVGLFVAVLVAFVCALGWDATAPSPSLLKIKPRAALFFGAAGLCQGIGLVGLYIALQIGLVSVVVPLYNLSPLFVLVLSWLFLKGVEKITGRILVGTLAIVSGVILIGLNS